MQANPRTIDELFNSQLRYVVPMFQRQYAWRETPQWSTLWEDVAEKAVLQIAKTKSNAHYLGAVIIEGVRPSSPREVKRFLVIDGQQRLTTLQLLLTAYRDIVRSRDWKTLDRTTSRFLENADADVMEHPDEERYKLWPTTLNRIVFSDIVCAGSREVLENKHPIVRLPRKRKPEPRNPLVAAYLYFNERIVTWIAASAAEYQRTEEDCAFMLLQALQQDFCVVEISLSEGDDSQEIFYSLNSQGRPLTQSDLLRSLIFMRAEKEKVDRDKLFDEYWGRYETPFWSAEISRAGRSYSRLDLGLRYFLVGKTGAPVDARRVNEEYRRWITSEPGRYPSVREELADFSRYAAEYQRYESLGTEKLASTDIRRIVRDFDVSTVLPLLMYLRLDSGLSQVQLTSANAYLESFIVRRAFTHAETKEYNQLFVEVLGTIKGVLPDELCDKLKQKLLAGGGTTRSWPADSQIIEAAISSPLYDQRRLSSLRVILERLELGLRDKKSEDHVIPEGIQIEHVLPQKWADHWPLDGKVIPSLLVLYPHLAKDEFAPLANDIRNRNARLQTLGNLSLVNQYLNPAAGNASFDDKKQEYAKSVLRLNRYFDVHKSWDEAAIATRSKTLGELFCKIWPRPS